MVGIRREKEGIERSIFSDSIVFGAIVNCRGFLEKGVQIRDQAEREDECELPGTLQSC
jgi:hypothetical protein